MLIEKDNIALNTETKILKVHFYEIPFPRYKSKVKEKNFKIKENLLTKTTETFLIMFTQATLVHRAFRISLQ